MFCFKRKFSKKVSKLSQICALQQIYTTYKTIFQIFYWTLVAWQKMQKERFEGKKEIYAAKYAIAWNA